MSISLRNSEDCCLLSNSEISHSYTVALDVVQGNLFIETGLLGLLNNVVAGLPKVKYDHRRQWDQKEASMSPSSPQEEEPHQNLAFNLSDPKQSPPPGFHKLDEEQVNIGIQLTLTIPFSPLNLPHRPAGNNHRPKVIKPPPQPPLTHILCESD